MTKMETIMSEFYNTLYKIRYPEITKAELGNIGSVIFTGENRIHLLSWLLMEKVPHIATVLGKLEGAALQDELILYYSQLGICVNKDILLGNCTLEEQLPTLTLLLEFIKNVYVNSTDVPTNEEESIANLFKAYFSEDTNNPSTTAPKLTYSEAVKYFEDLKILDEPNQSSRISVTDQLLDDIENNSKENSNEQQKNFISQIEKFLDAYGSVSSWPVSLAKTENTLKNSVDPDIKSIHSDFTILKQILHMKDEIPKLELPNAPKKINSNKSLNSLVEDIVICTEKNIDML